MSDQFGRCQPHDGSAGPFHHAAANNHESGSQQPCPPSPPWPSEPQQQCPASTPSGCWPSVSNKDIAEALLRAIKRAGRDAKLSALVFSAAGGDQAHGYSSRASSQGIVQLVTSRTRILAQVRSGASPCTHGGSGRVIEGAMGGEGECPNPSRLPASSHPAWWSSSLAAGLGRGSCTHVPGCLSAVRGGGGKGGREWEREACSQEVRPPTNAGT